MPAKERGRCNTCHLTFALRGDGTLRAHGYGLYAQRCPGSHHLPEGAEMFTYQVTATMRVRTNRADVATGLVQAQLTRDHPALEVFEIRAIRIHDEGS